MEVLKALLQQASSSGSRSTALQPLIWFTGLVICALLVRGYYVLPFWILLIFSVLAILGAIIFLTFFVYFALRNPDLLRSEKFTLSKMAIEKNIMGDSNTGFIEVPEFEETINAGSPAERFLGDGE